MAYDYFSLMNMSLHKFNECHMWVRVVPFSFLCSTWLPQFQTLREASAQPPTTLLDISSSVSQLHLPRKGVGYLRSDATLNFSLLWMGCPGIKSPTLALGTQLRKPKVWADEATQQAVMVGAWQIHQGRGRKTQRLSNKDVFLNMELYWEFEAAEFQAALIF